MLTSIITPAFNAAKTLRRAHESVQKQTLASWEHIIIDDGSTDETREVLSDLCTDRRVIVTGAPNGGEAAALNLGIRLSSGEYVGFLDADDEYLPDHIEAHVAELGTPTDVDLLWGGLEVIAGSPDDLLVPDVEAGTGYISVHECVCQGTLFGKRAVFENVGFTADRAVWWQDYDFFQRAKKVYTVRKFERPTYRYYRNSGASLVDRVKGNWNAARSATGRSG